MVLLINVKLHMLLQVEAVRNVSILNDIYGFYLQILCIAPRIELVERAYINL
jgi:hypothetical protein